MQGSAPRRRNISFHMSADRVELPTGTVTFLFTDIEGSTQLWGRAPQAMNAALAMHDALFREVVPARRGVIFKTVGDAVCAVFERADDAIYAAVDAQRRLPQLSWPSETGALRVRMGIHTGQAIERDNDYFGPALNRVARLMSIAHGGQAITSKATAAVIEGILDPGVQLLSLGVHRLSDLTEPETAFQLIAEGLSRDFPALRSVDHHPNNLPSQISSFIGRSRELAAVPELLRQHRLVTLVGPGGIGKTRLAVQVAASMVADHAGGTWFVEFANLHDGNLVASTIGRALGVDENQDRPLEDLLVGHLREQPALLVLDNSEHLLSDIAKISKRLLAGSGSLRILATSREPLFVTGEHVFRLAPLSSVAGDAVDEATQLFLERARGSAPNVAARDDALPTIARICRRLEGIPLAIELAAARAGALTLSDIEARLSNRLSLLVSRDVTQDDRHRALRATIEWSYNLLTPPERRFARGLSVFEGSFSLEAAERIIRERAAADLIESLSYKSLIVPSEDPHSARYAISDTIREYLRETATEAGEASVLQERHFSYFSATILDGAGNADAASRAVWIRFLEDDLANIRTAFEWGIAFRRELFAQCAVSLTPFWQFTGRLIEGERTVQRALALDGLANRMRGALLRRASTFATMRSNHERAYELSVQARDVYAQIGDSAGIAETTFNIAVIEHRLGNANEATVHYLEARRAFAEANHVTGEVRTTMNLVLLALESRDVEAAREHLNHAEVRAVALSDGDVDSDLDNLRAMVLCRDAHFAEAIALYEQILERKRQIGNRYAIADLLAEVVEARLGLADVSGAIEDLREIFRIASDIEVPGSLVTAFEASAEVLLGLQRFDDAVRAHSTARRLRLNYRYFSGKIGDEARREAILRAHVQSDRSMRAVLDDAAPLDQSTALRGATFF
jgi:predicted ATPase/class 3 adenylate cyclase